jgi:hypothetical protein
MSERREVYVGKDSTLIEGVPPRLERRRPTLGIGNMIFAVAMCLLVVRQIGLIYLAAGICIGLLGSGLLVAVWSVSQRREARKLYREGSILVTTAIARRPGTGPVFGYIRVYEDRLAWNPRREPASVGRFEVSYQELRFMSLQRQRFMSSAVWIYETTHGWTRIGIKVRVAKMSLVFNSTQGLSVVTRSAD